MDCTAPETCNLNSYSSGGGAIDSGDDGGDGTLTVSASTFVGGSAHYGGGISTWGNGSVSTSTFSANWAGYGGGLSNWGLATFSVSSSTFSGNIAGANGGGIFSSGESSTVLLVSSSTFFGNRALGNPKAPGVDSFDAAGDGGAIANADDGSGTLAVWASTFSSNIAAGSGSAITNGINGGRGVPIIGVVETAADIFNGTCDQLAGSSWSDQGYNVGSNPTCLGSPGTGDVSHGAGILTPLIYEGGPTATISPLPGNPGIGLVPLSTTVTFNASTITLCPTTDQRGVDSAPGKACNAGAVQFG